LITGSRRFALFRDVSRPVRGLTAVARSVPMRLVAGFVRDEAGGDPAYRIRSAIAGLPPTSVTFWLWKLVLSGDLVLPRVCDGLS